MMRHRRSATTAAALALGALLVGVFGVAAPASAHVSVNPKEATQGGYGRLAFRVPTESDTAATTKVEVVLPENAPVASVSTMPVPGWTVTTEKRKLEPPLEVHGSPVTEAVSKITWTASGDAGIKGGQFQEFPVSMGPLPKVDTMVFKALQTYSDGNVVRWIEEPPAAGGQEPEHPAPVLKLLPAAAASASPAAGAAKGDSADDDEDEGNSVALGLGVAGLVAGLGGLALGGLAFARTRRPAGTPAA
ncbi:YcnI family protein [Micromonospora sp. NPDC049679]|uniref:YcnI family copper-binding membrane protein n=1 Tax=Micromonospora sp. NPDC049679 TaxID=3155920 RepID=UPI0033D39E1D